MKHSIFYKLILIIIILNFSCSDDEVRVDPTAGLIKIHEGYAIGAAAKVELWSKESFQSAYNKVVAVLYDSVSNARLTDAHISYAPEMSMMGGMKHACPVENPEEEAINQGFPGAIEFIMPSGDMGSWKLKVNVHNQANNKSGIAQFGVTVNNPAQAKVKSFVTESAEKIFVAYYFPSNMKVGTNDFEVIVYKMASAYEFVPVEDYSFVLTPEMPSMGHGSPNNVNPVYDATGHYKGKVNFTMTGDWRLNLSISKSNVAVKDLYFDVTLE